MGGTTGQMIIIRKCGNDNYRFIVYPNVDTIHSLFRSKKFTTWNEVVSAVRLYCENHPEITIRWAGI